MNFRIHIIILGLFILAGCQSLRLEKRLYSNGYYISANKSDRASAAAIPKKEIRDSIDAIASIDAVIPEENRNEKPELITIKKSSSRISEPKPAVTEKGSSAMELRKERTIRSGWKIKKVTGDDEELPDETITLIVLGFLLLGLIMFLIFVPVTQSWMIILWILVAIIAIAAFLALMGFAGPDILFPLLGGSGGILYGIVNFLFYYGII